MNKKKLANQEEKELEKQFLSSFNGQCPERIDA